MTHEELCEATARKFVQTFALWEVRGKWENPDVITWNSSGRSTIYEIKMSRSDFLADFKKKCRQEDHKKAGDRFAYVCYGDFIKPDEIPEDWGLYYFINGKFKAIKYPAPINDWEGKNRDWQGEVIMLVNYIVTNKFFNNQRYVFNKRYK
jgi:hypothetical protein